MVICNEEGDTGAGGWVLAEADGQDDICVRPQQPGSLEFPIPTKQQLDELEAQPFNAQCLARSGDESYNMQLLGCQGIEQPHAEQLMGASAYGAQQLGNSRAKTCGGWEQLEAPDKQPYDALLEQLTGLDPVLPEGPYAAYAVGPEQLEGPEAAISDALESQLEGTGAAASDGPQEQSERPEAATSDNPQQLTGSDAATFEGPQQAAGLADAATFDAPERPEDEEAAEAAIFNGSQQPEDLGAEPNHAQQFDEPGGQADEAMLQLVLREYGSFSAQEVRGARQFVTDILSVRPAPHGPSIGPMAAALVGIAEGLLRQPAFQLDLVEAIARDSDAAGLFHHVLRGPGSHLPALASSSRPQQPLPEITIIDDDAGSATTSTGAGFTAGAGQATDPTLLVGTGPTGSAGPSTDAGPFASAGPVNGPTAAVGHAANAGNTTGAGALKGPGLIAVAGLATDLGPTTSTGPTASTTGVASSAGYTASSTCLTNGDAGLFGPTAAGPETDGGGPAHSSRFLDMFISALERSNLTYLAALLRCRPLPMRADEGSAEPAAAAIGADGTTADSGEDGSSGGGHEGGSSAGDDSDDGKEPDAEHSDGGGTVHEHVSRQQLLHMVTTLAMAMFCIMVVRRRLGRF